MASRYPTALPQCPCGSIPARSSLHYPSHVSRACITAPHHLLNQPLGDHVLAAPVNRRVQILRPSDAKMLARRPPCGSQPAPPAGSQTAARRSDAAEHRRNVLARTGVNDATGLPLDSTISMLRCSRYMSLLSIVSAHKGRIRASHRCRVAACVGSSARSTATLSSQSLPASIDAICHIQQRTDMCCVAPVLSPSGWPSACRGRRS